MDEFFTTIIIGAGASGLMTAARLTDSLILERNEKAGKKIYITGKGRCNLTNLCDPQEFLKNVVNGSRFLTGCINRFPPEKTVDYFNSIGLETVTERGGRVFPLSNKASDVTKALLSKCAQIRYNSMVTSIIPLQDNGSSQLTPRFKISYQCQGAAHTALCRNVVVATGGKSYAATGSDGNGYALALSLGHTVTEPKCALTGFILEENVAQLSGLTLKNVAASIIQNGQKLSFMGEMLFTHKGVSGPIILSLSSHANRMNSIILSVDLKPALSEDMLDRRIISDFEKNNRRELKNVLTELLPKSLIEYIIEFAELKGDKKVNFITKDERLRLVKALKSLTFTVEALCGFSEAVVTSGGVSLKEVSPKTMESNKFHGLYFIGELLDSDAYTGGFNLQIAFSTACACAEAINKE